MTRIFKYLYAHFLFLSLFLPPLQESREKDHGQLYSGSFEIEDAHNAFKFLEVLTSKIVIFYIAMKGRSFIK